MANVAPDQYTALSVRRDGPRTTVLMRRPEVHNAFDEVLIAELHEAFDAVARDSSTRVVVLAGEGRSFSAGADLGWMRRAVRLSEDENRASAAALAAMIRAVAECPRPVVARVQGSALGGGAGLVAAVDVAIAAEDARFGFTEARLGLIPATVAPVVIEKVGPGRARALFLTAERFDAVRAFAAGLVHRVVPEVELDAAVDEAVAALLAGGPAAQRQAKELIREVPRRARDEVDAYTSALLARVRAGEEGREGVRAFLEKRQPRWTTEAD